MNTNIYKTHILIKKIDNLEVKINELENKIDSILNILDKEVSPNCNKMSIHIEFIENIYDTIKNPLHYMCKKIDNLIGNQKFINN